MDKLRIIAVERVLATGGELEPAIGCALVDGRLHVYDTFGELYRQREYFADLDSVDELVRRGKYDWTDFELEKGQVLTRDRHNRTYVAEEEIEELLRPLPGACNGVAALSVELYYRFLCILYRENPALLELLETHHREGHLYARIRQMCEEAPFEGLTELDRRLIVGSRVEGVTFLMKSVRRLLVDAPELSYHEITHLFSRLFLLEQHGYIDLRRLTECKESLQGG